MRRSHRGQNFHLQARPFEEILVGNPTGNNDIIRSLGGNPGYAIQQYQPYANQPNSLPGTQHQTILHTGTMPSPYISIK